MFSIIASNQLRNQKSKIWNAGVHYRNFSNTHRTVTQVPLLSRGRNPSTRGVLLPRDLLLKSRSLTPQLLLVVLTPATISLRLVLIAIEFISLYRWTRGPPLSFRAVCVTIIYLASLPSRPDVEYCVEPSEQMDSVGRTEMFDS